MLLSAFLFLLAVLHPSKSSLQGDEVAKWAENLGKDLWGMGQAITKIAEIKETYVHYNARVNSKDPQELLAEIKENILRMMDRKMDAIRCIQQTAEKESEFFELGNDSFVYYSSKYSQIEGEPLINLAESIANNSDMYRKMHLNKDTHFYNLAVNTTHSSVHVPMNVYDKYEDAAFAIQWSEALDKVFVQNYNSDPALSWQYFGSLSGVMRHYPAKRWENPPNKDLFDCRIRTWFIEAATCTKDVVILIDNSGSMDGMGRHIGALTTYSILETLSNNDYVNIMNYSSTTNYTVPCFEGMLVQATKENIRVFKEAVSELKPSGKTSLGQALEKAFDLLAEYRIQRKCNESNANCNQVIMIVTDGVSANLSETVMKYNYLNNGSHIPVRIFTYLIGKEVQNIPEIQWIACSNRGYHSHVQTLEQVTTSVLQYINVIARPLVLQEDEHPVSWTHAYIDRTYDDAKDDQINEPYRLLTSAAIPCFDRKTNTNNATRTADLLGVAGTDVPIDDFVKLTLPYKIGVNAYAFMVSNNGYVLMHPDLRPVFEGTLKENYNSIDLTEVEQLDGELEPREIGDRLQELRSALVNGEEGSLHDVKIKYHYDDLRRVARESYDYYYTPLEDTPFSLGIAIPSLYKNYSLDTDDEIQKNQHTGKNLTDFFKGKWKIHPKWVYCRYHYLEGHEFPNPENELLHFLGRMYNRDFVWKRQYEASKAGSDSKFGIEKEDLAGVECGRKTLGNEDYFCDRKLIERLVFDARVTMGPFQEGWDPSTNNPEVLLFKRFNATLRFVATMSGLTRWDYIFENPKKYQKNFREFGDLHSKAIDETWYKSAVIQHQYESESFVYSVSPNNEDDLVTGSYAIFPKEGGNEAPGSVVGYQFSLSKLVEIVTNISTKLTNRCNSNLYCGRCNDTLTCYIVDSSGYIIVSLDSEATNQTGKFIGEVAGDVLESMVEKDIFEKVTVYDSQALCKYETDKKSSSNTLLTPLDFLSVTVSWILINFLWLTSNLNFYTIINPYLVLSQDFNQTVIVEQPNESEEEIINVEEHIYYACDKQIDLYILNQSLFQKGEFIGEIPSSSVSRQYYIKKIPNSNLVFLAINSSVKVTNTVQFTTNPIKIEYENMLACEKINLNNLTRRRLKGCFNEHPLESEIKTCGRASTIQNINLLALTIILSIIST